MRALSILELTLGCLLGLVTVRFIIVVVVNFGGLALYGASRLRIEEMAGDALAAAILYSLARWLLRAGMRHRASPRSSAVTSASSAR